MATVGELLGILKRLTAKHPDAAWKLLLDIFPKHHSSITDSYKPSPWRSWAEGWTGEVAATDYWRYISGIADLALNLATADDSRWPELLDHCTALSPADRSQIFAALEQINPATLNDEQCTALWNALREMVQKHTAFHDAGWALPVEEVQRLGAIRDRFAPQDVVEVAVPLFSDGQLIYERIDLPFKEREASLSQRRQSAIERIWNTNGLSGVLALATKVKESWLVGIALAEAKDGEPDSLIIPDLLCSSDRHIEGFAGAYTATRIDAEGQDWAERIPSAALWTPEQITAFACRMHFNSRTWDWVESVSPEVKQGYWAKIRFSSVPQEQTHLEKALRELLLAKRPATAVRLLAMGMYKKAPVSSALLFEALEAMQGAGIEDWRTLETYYIRMMIERLQADEQADESRLGRLEFGLLHILSEYTLRPHTLERLLARDPKLFVDCLKVLYRPHNAAKDEDSKQLDTGYEEKVKLVWGLLRDWQRIPGTQPDGNISGSELRDWVTGARRAAQEADRLEVCDVRIGELFAYAPSDVNGITPCVPVREIIEKFESDHIDRGFAIGLFNLGGPYWKDLFDGGHRERDFAADYERYAKACETQWPRTAAALRSVAQSYLQMAAHEDAEAEMRK